MLNRTWGLLTLAIGLICGYAAFNNLVLVHSRPFGTEVLQGALSGFGLALVTNHLVAKARSVRVNGWVTMRGCGEPGNSMFKRAACSHAFLGPINSFKEAAYWIASVDGKGRPLSGDRRYTMHFPADGLPPNDAFWSLTMGDASHRFVPNPLHRHSLGDRSGLVRNPDGSIDIHIQRTASRPGPRSGGSPAWFA